MAQNLWVHCRVHPPLAEIEILDDGDGLGSPREDSHGLRIMRERAERIGATLSVESPSTDGRGTRCRSAWTESDTQSMALLQRGASTKGGAR